MKTVTDIVYRLNERDEIFYVNEAYDAFAAANAGQGAASSAVLHRPLWDFIADRTTLKLYDDIVERVRTGRRLTFPFRCDAPDRRRRMQLRVSPGKKSIVEFRSRCIEEQHRPFQSLLDPSRPVLAESLCMCSWCKRVEVEDDWLEVEDAVTKLRLFDQSVLPGVVHGICEPCYRRAIETIEGG